MKRLPKGMKRISKADFSKEIMSNQEQKNIPFALEKKEYIDWAEKDEKKPTRKTYRW